MEYHDHNLAEIECLRSTMHRLADEGEDYSKVLAVSQELDTLIVKFQKSILYGFFSSPAPG
jgi:hypothetical protein